jgi:hypothetical protein
MKFFKGLMIGLAISMVFWVCAYQVFAAEPAKMLWDAPATGHVDGYIVEWMPTADLPTESNWNTKSVGDVLTVKDIDKVFGLYPGIRHSFRVLAWNISGPSGPSNVIEYTRPEWAPPEDTVIEEINIPIPSLPGTLILNFITPEPQ